MRARQLTVFVGYPLKGGRFEPTPVFQYSKVLKWFKHLFQIFSPSLLWLNEEPGGSGALVHKIFLLLLLSQGRNYRF